MSEESRQDLLAKVNPDRREFLGKIAIAAAFAAPTVATFSLDGMRKKAFAQQAYDRPRVLSVQDTGEGYKAVVTFSQPMNMIDMFMFGVTDVRATPVAAPCCSFTVTPSGAFVHSVTWSGNMHQVIQFCTAHEQQLTATYNWGDCRGATKFTGVNGLELEPFSRTVPVSGNCG